MAAAAINLDTAAKARYSVVVWGGVIELNIVLKWNSNYNSHQFSVDGKFPVLIETILHLLVRHELKGPVRDTKHSWNESLKGIISKC